MLIARATIYKDGQIVDHVRPRRDLFYMTDAMTGTSQLQTNMSIPGMHRTLEGDFYARIEYNEGNTVTFRVYWNPLVNFVWLGGFILIFGTLVALWPSGKPSPIAEAIAAQSRLGRVGAGED